MVLRHIGYNAFHPTCLTLIQRLALIKSKRYSKWFLPCLMTRSENPGTSSPHFSSSPAPSSYTFFLDSQIEYTISPLAPEVDSCAVLTQTCEKRRDIVIVGFLKMIIVCKGHGKHETEQGKLLQNNQEKKFTKILFIGR